jgi:hypothetical protein
MRRFSGKLRPNLRPRLRPVTSFLAASLLMLSLVCRDRFAFSQSPEPPQIPQVTSQPRIPDPFGQGQGAHMDPNVRHAQLEAAKKRNLERQSRIVNDANKIVQLAQEVNADVEKGEKPALSPIAAKKTEEIEKLAKGVKERMKAAD